MSRTTPKDIPFPVAHLRAAVLDEDESRTIICRVLGLHDARAVSEQHDARRRLQWLAILNTANECLRRHRTELGANAYAVFKTMTELGRTLAHAPGTHRETDSRQKLARAWLAEFARGVRVRAPRCISTGHMPTTGEGVK